MCILFLIVLAIHTGYGFTFSYLLDCIIWRVSSWFPNQGSNPCPTVMEMQSLNHWTTKKSGTLLYC